MRDICSDLCSPSLFSNTCEDAALSAEKMAKHLSSVRQHPASPTQHSASTGSRDAVCRSRNGAGSLLLRSLHQPHPGRGAGRRELETSIRSLLVIQTEMANAYRFRGSLPVTFLNLGV